MLELTDIYAGYDGHPVLRGIDILVPDHRVVVLLGPNGAGKTTLLRVASGLLRPTSGQVTLGGESVTDLPPDQRATRGLCHVPEGRGIFRSMSVRDNLRLQAPADLDVDLDPVEVACTAFPRLGERLDQIAGTMSGGEQQMLSLARAYVAEPEVILLDEVSMGLAPRIVDEIYEHLAVLASAGRALLLVEQYVSRALALADYVYVMGKGRIEIVAEPDELGDDAVLASYLGAAS